MKLCHYIRVRKVTLQFGGHRLVQDPLYMSLYLTSFQYKFLKRTVQLWSSLIIRHDHQTGGICDGGDGSICSEDGGIYGGNGGIGVE